MHLNCSYECLIADEFCILYRITNNTKFRKSIARARVIFLGFVIFVVFINFLKFKNRNDFHSK